jgi:SAM-dependent methyltransferase
MASIEVKEYYDATVDREVRLDLKQAIDLVGDHKVAIDCGCGAGSDIAFLRANGFVVFGFDIESESITRCMERFRGDSNVFLSQDSFNSFNYPIASLILADASLFFCREDEFDQVWRKVTESLTPGGIFVGSFLGQNDTMAGTDYQREAFWPNVLVFTEDRLTPYFRDFEIIKWSEFEESGETALGTPHHWHIYSVVARNLTSK